MSIEAVSFAYQQNIKPASLKFLLITLANYADIKGHFWPSVDHLVRMTSLDRKTIIKGISLLEAAGYISDTGLRKGQTSSVKVYLFSHPNIEKPIEKPIPKTEQLKQYHLTPEAVPSIPVSSTVFGNPPAPPIKKNPYLNHKEPKIYMRRKNPKVTLAEWEREHGSLKIEMMGSWIRGARANPKKVITLIEEFREKVTAGGNQYANFAMAFKVWLRSGYLSMKIDQVENSTPENQAQIWEHGIRP